MASLKKASKSVQRTHRERTQPDARKHLGPLEKKKDYKLRARDYQEKKESLKRLHQKAEEKNPDEFYFHMINSRLQDGVHKELWNEEDTAEQKALLKTQDLRYVQFKLDLERKKIESLKATLHFIDPELPRPNTHTVFMDSKKKIWKFDAAKYLKTHPSFLSRAHNRPNLKDLMSGSMLTVPRESLTAADREKRLKYAQLLKRIQREKELTVVAAKLQVKKHIATTTAKDSKPFKVKRGSGKSAPVYKWKQERKK